MYTPKPLQWDDALTTGDENIDDQHRFLVDTLNTLGEAINDGHGTDMISRILGRLRFYAGWHFDREEECFSRYSCPAAEVNKNAHQKFTEKFDRYHKDYMATGGSNELALKIHEEIADWIVNHILRIDGELYPCIHHRPKPKR